MKYFAVYDTTGLILRHGRCADDVLELQGDYVLELESEAPSDMDLTHCVLGGELAPRPTFDIPAELQLAVGTSHELTLPIPCTVTFEGEEHIITDGAIAIDADMPSEYELLFTHWPNLPHTLKVIVQ